MTIRVHSADEARGMALFAYGKPTADVPVTVETHPAYWIVRIGPDASGDSRSYLITPTDDVAAPLLDEVIVVADPNLRVIPRP